MPHTPHFTLLDVISLIILVTVSNPEAPHYAFCFSLLLLPCPEAQISSSAPYSRTPIAYVVPFI